MDLEVVRVLGPIAAIIVVGVLLAYVWDKTHRPLKVDLSVTLKQKWNGRTIMGHEDLPAGLDIFENYLEMIIADNGHYLFCGLGTNNTGPTVFTTDRIVWQPEGTADYGAPTLTWRPTDGAAILGSISEGGMKIFIGVVPGVNKDGTGV